MCLLLELGSSTHSAPFHMFFVYLEVWQGPKKMNEALD